MRAIASTHPGVVERVSAERRPRTLLGRDVGVDPDVTPVDGGIRK